MRAIAVAMLTMVALGAPFSLPKVVGGFGYVWVGIELQLQDHAVGISIARARWLIDWIKQTDVSGVVLVRDLVAVLGRLAFAAGPLERIRPFLACIYSWVAVVPPGACLKPPPAVQLCLGWIAEKLSKPGGRLSLCRPVSSTPVEIFRKDAKADGDDVVVAGWECRGGATTEKARWFSIRLDATNSPWIYCRGEPYRVVAAPELHATVFGVFAFMPPWDQNDGSAIIT